MKSFTSALRRSTISMLAFLAATALWAVLPPATAGAVTFTVNRNDDIPPRVTTCVTPASTDCTLREAVIKLNATAACAPPNAPCIINFAASTNSGPILLTITSTSNAADASTGDLDINANVEIQGNGPANTVIQGDFPVADNKDDKIFGINQDGTHANLQVTINNVTIKGGRNSVLFNDLSFAWTGGGIDIFLIGTTAKTVLSNCVITENTNVHGYGGGINISSVGSQPGVFSGSVEITNCEISNNHELGTANPSTTAFGTCGGGICTGFSDNHNVTITDSQISGNTTPGSGGGIGIFMNNGTVAIHNSMIGGAQLPSAGCTDCGNTAGRQGGGINANGLGAQTVIIDQESVIQNNVAGTSTVAPAVGSGGGIQSGNSASSSTTLSKVTIIGNSVSPNAPTQRGGGGILAGGNLTVGFSRIVGNSGGTGGGNGLRVDNGGAGTVIATNNWWGCNDGPSAAPCDTAVLSGSGAGGATLTFNPWLVLSLDANPSTVAPNGASTLTADFLHKSDATAVVPADIAVLLGLPIAFGATLGAISGAQATIQATGTATATFTHDATCVAGTANATVDTTPGPTVSVNPIAVTCPDLTAAKSNNVGGNVPLSAGSWTWTILVANGGAAPANFANGQTMLTDTLPGGANIAYGVAGTSKLTGITGTISCGIALNVLTCTASGAVTIAAPGSFEVSFTATVSAAGTYANPTGGSCGVDPNGNVPETNEANNSCSNSVTVVGPPTISKAFSPSSIAVGGTSTLSFTLANPNTGVALSGVAFSDTLPAGVEVAAAPNANNACAGTVTATAGTGVISLSDGSIAAGQSCAISVDVTATSGGAKDNTAGAVSSTNGGTGAASNTATLTVTGVGAGELTALSPANVWIGLKNSDSVGLRVDLRAEVFVKVGASETLVGSGDLLNRSTGSSGFNNAILHTIPLTLTGGSAAFPTGAALEIRVSVRRACTGPGHTSGTVRLWYNGQKVDSGPTRDAGSRFDATIGGQMDDYFLKTGLGLSKSAGSPRTSVDQSVNSAVACASPGGRPFTSFGTWSTP